MAQRQGTEQGQSPRHTGNIGATAWHNLVGWVRQESAAATALVQAFIALGIAFEWWHWSPAQTGAVIGIVAALLGMFVRSQVTPIHRLKPQAGQLGPSGPGTSAGFRDEGDSGVRVLPAPGAGVGPAGRPPGGPPTRPDTGPPPTRPDMGAPGAQGGRGDVGPPGGPSPPPGAPPNYPGPGPWP